MDEKTLEWLSQNRTGKSLNTSIHLLLPVLLLSWLTGAVLEISGFFGVTLAAVLLYSICTVISAIVLARVVQVKLFEVAFFTLLNLLLVPLSILSSVHYPSATKSLALSSISLALPVVALISRTKTELNRGALLRSVYAFVVPCAIASGLTEDTQFVVTFATDIVIAFSIAVLCGATSLFRMHIHIPATRLLFFVLALLSGSFAVYCYANSTTLFQAAITATVASTALFFHHDYVNYQMRVPLCEYTDRHASLSVSHVLVKITAVWAIACWGGVATVIAHEPEHKRQPDFYFFVYVAYFGQLAGSLVLHEALQSQLREHELPKVKVKKEKVACMLTAITVDILLMILLAGYYCLSPRPLLIHIPVLLMTQAVLFLCLTYILDNIRHFMAPYNTRIRDACAGLIAYCLLYIIYTTFTLDHSKRSNSTMVGAKTTNFTGQTVIPDGEEWNRQVYPVLVALIAIFYCVPLIVHFMHAIDEQKQAKKERLSRRWADDKRNSENDDNDKKQLI